MSVEPLILELQQRGLISDRLTAKLRNKVAKSDRPLSAKQVARFLVQKNHLSDGQAVEVLSALTARGIDVDGISMPGLTSGFVPDDADDASAGRATNITSAADRRSESVSSEFEAATADESPEDSSIFAPFLRGKPDNDGPGLTSPAPPATVPAAGEGSASDPSSGTPTPLDERELDRQSRAKQLAANRLAASARSAAKGHKKAKTKRPEGKSEWDSPLILIGGGTLTLLVLGGVTLLFLYFSETGDEKLGQAQAAMESGSYSQAIHFYEEYLEDYPRHPKRSAARVQLAMARLRKDTESGNFVLALQDAQSELAAIESEEKFEEAHAELAALLPRIALGLANQAEQAAERPDEAVKFIDQSTTALALASNSKYVPASLRDRGEIEEVQVILSRVSRRQQSQTDLQQAIEMIEASVAAGDTREAYTIHRQVINAHPELLSNEALAAAVRETSAAELAQIRFVAEEQPSETAQTPLPWVASLATANRRRGPSVADGASTAASATICVSIDGAIYGLDATTGRLVWRRHVGFGSAGAPIPHEGDFIVVDHVRHELLRLDAAAGEIRWRQAIGEHFAPPLLVGQRAYLAAESGRLYLVDLAAGARAGYIEFPQPLHVTPAVDRRQERLYLTGEQFSLYSISLTDMSCQGVYYLGHAKGSVRVSPAPILERLAVVENDGLATSRLLLLSLDDRGAPVGEETQRRLTGLAASSPMVANRRLILATDRGQLDVYDVSSASGDAALTLVATRNANDREPLMRHFALSEEHIWVGDTQLTKYAVLPTGNRLPVESIDDSFSGATFDHPMQIVGDALVHVRRPKGRAGVAVAATHTREGSTLWETELAVPLASAPVTSSSARAFAVASANGSVFHFDEATIRSGVQDRPLEARGAPTQVPTLSDGVDLGDGRAAFCAPGLSNQLLLYNGNADGGDVRWIELPSPLACNVTPFGEGMLVPLSVGQVFYLSAADGRQLATPFQPRLTPNAKVDFRPAAALSSAERQFVISDGGERIYLVGMSDRPQPHLASVGEGSVGSFPIASPMFVLGDLAAAVTAESHLLRFRLPSLEAIGELKLPGAVVWGPFQVGGQLLMATSNDQLLSVAGNGDVAWSTPLERSDLTGPPLVVDGGVLIAYRSGVLERRDLANGASAAEVDVRHSLSAGPVHFMGHILLTSHDGTLLVVNQP